MAFTSFISLYSCHAAGALVAHRLVLPCIAELQRTLRVRQSVATRIWRNMRSILQMGYTLFTKTNGRVISVTSLLYLTLLFSCRSRIYSTPHIVPCLTISPLVVSFLLVRSPQCRPVVRLIVPHKSPNLNLSPTPLTEVPRSLLCRPSLLPTTGQTVISIQSQLVTLKTHSLSQSRLRVSLSILQ